ncbi:hypothetical protein B566_EDAN004585 [Ephemera danica]|nr:hypothetical protein B566_EDAN004585 [Ephemera danica]
MTETSCLATFTPRWAGLSKIGSCGVPVPLTELKIVDEAGNALPQGDEGELLVRGPQVMQGYHNNESATRDTITEDGWLRTGDVAHVDDQGYVFLVDRMKELIKVKGLQVSPTELEGVLRKLDGVADVAVVGVPDERSGEVPRAFVVRANNSQISETDVKSFLESKVAVRMLPARHAASKTRIAPAVTVFLRGLASAPEDKLPLLIDSDNVIHSPLSDVVIPDKNVAEYVWRNADRWKDKPALVTGLKPGDAIGLVMPNCPEFALTLLGAAGAGLIVTPANPAYTAEELSRQFRDAGAKAVVTVPPLLDTVREALERSGGAQLIVSCASEADEAQLGSDVLSLRALLSREYTRRTPRLPREVPRAFVVRANNSQISETDVKSFVESKVASFKRLAGGVRFVKEIPKSAAEELSRQLRDAGAKAVVTVPPLLDKVREALERSGGAQLIVSCASEADEAQLGPGVLSLRALLSREYTRHTPRLPRPDPDQLAVLPYSSGTTGLPKGVRITHRNMVANLCQMHHPEILPLDIGIQDVALGLLPFFHIYGLNGVLTVNLSLGRHTVTMPRFDPALFVASFSRFKPTVLSAVPPILNFLALTDKVTPEDLHRLRSVISGAAPVTRPVIEAFLGKTNAEGVDFRQGYGMTETSCMALFTPPNCDLSKISAAGVPVPLTELKIISETDVMHYMESRVAPFKRLAGGVRFVKEIPKNAAGKIERKIIRHWD